MTPTRTTGHRTSRPGRSLRRGLAAGAVAALLATGLGACGDHHDASGDTGATAAPASSGSASPAAAAQPGQEVTPADFVARVRHGLDASTTAHLTMAMDLGQLGRMSGRGEIDYTAKPAEMALTLTMPQGMPMAAGKPADLRFVDGMLYLSMGDLTGGRFWKIDPSDPSGPLAGAGFGQLMDQMDPGRMLTGFEDGIDAVTYVGPEDVAGRRLDHYRLTVDTAAMMRSMGVPRSQAAGAPRTVHYDVWLDDRDRFAQMTMQLPVAGTEASMRMELTDWGGAVHIAAPPAGQVTDPSRISG